MEPLGLCDNGARGPRRRARRGRTRARVFHRGGAAFRVRRARPTFASRSRRLARADPRVSRSVSIRGDVTWLGTPTRRDGLGECHPGELADALREVDWNMRPRPLTEFFAKFTPPKSQSKLTSRLKCNVYYYRANYFCILVGCFLVAFFRNPWALVACAMACFSLLCANDSFAQSFSERATRTVRKYYPPAAAWMRRSAGQAGVLRDRTRE